MTKSVFDRNFVQLILYLIFLVIPTGLISHPFLSKISDQIYFLQRNQLTEYLVVTISISISFALYFFRLRFWIGLFGAFLVGYFLYKGILLNEKGEFDVFYATITFMHHAILFGFGWLLGFGLAKYRYFPLFISLLIFGVGIIEIAKNKTISGNVFLTQILPVVIYAVYNYYIRENLENLQNFNLKAILKFSVRTFLFLFFVVCLFLIVKNIFYAEIKAIEHEYSLASQYEHGKGNDEDTENMLKKNADNDLDLNEYAKLKSRLGKSDELLFAAYLDNFFDIPGLEEIPNPLYFTSYHLSKYNVEKEQFEVDPNAPSKDLFLPKPNTIPLYFQRTDTSILELDKQYLYKRPVEVDVYLALLSPSVFTAPSTAYSCQPISIDPDYRNQFKFAYKAKSLISSLNSAYFVYNPGKDKDLKAFQEMRIKILKQVKNYNKVDSAFYAYYTHLPKGPVFDSIAQLAKKITRNAKTPIEKVIAVRDFFLSKDQFGKPLFKYTLTPGSPNEPNIPNASKLAYFLFKNRKGYCTYFAGASLFLLRSVGVPVRMVSGFLTVDRSEKNKGWYWFYGDQAHAWIQVYFPDYGWLDFDTTIPDETIQEAPRPDGTPPMNPPKAYFTGVGTVKSVDTTTYTVTIALEQMMLRNREYVFKNPPLLTFDVSKAVIKKEKLTKKIQDIKPNIMVAGVSFDIKMRRIAPPTENEKSVDFVKRLDNPLKINELYIHTTDNPRNEQKLPESVPEKDWKKIVLKLALLLFITIILIIALLPLILYQYYLFRAKISKDLKQKAHFAYRSILFLLNQLGHFRMNKTPYQYAKYDIDPLYNINLESFINVYLKIKYSTSDITTLEKNLIKQFATNKHNEILSKVPFKKRLFSFINIIHTQKYFITPIENFNN
jgi:transglutaminase-like putative cysteine protease